MTVVGDFVAVNYYPGAVFEVYEVDDDPWMLQCGTTIGRFSSSGISPHISGCSSAPPPSIHMHLFCPAVGKDFSDYPAELFLWKSAPVRALCEMEVLILYAEWTAPPFRPDWLYFYLWERRIDPPNRYDVPKLFRRRQRLRAA